MRFHNLKIDGLIFYIYQFNVQSMLEFNKTIRQLKEHSKTCKHCFGTFFLIINLLQQNM